MSSSRNASIPSAARVARRNVAATVPRLSLLANSKLYSDGRGGYTNGAESFFSRLRRGAIGHYHHIAGPYLVRYAQESAWREDHRRVDNGRQVMAIAGLAMMAPTSIDWCGYWQRANH